MAKYFIKSISIEGFRGINNVGNPLVINFQTNGVTSIFGENGQGKSSIFEAFLFSILGKILRFEDYHNDIKDKKTIKNLFHPNDGEIKLEFVDDLNRIVDISVTVNENGERRVSSQTCTSPEKFLKSLCSTLNFIDYKSFEKIILTSSEETGKLFSNLVGFGSFINIKDKFDKIFRTQNINTDFGKLTKENSIRDNSVKIAALELEVQIKLKNIGIEISPNDNTEIFKALKTFLNKQYKLKVTNFKNNLHIDFDQLIKKKIGSDYESNVSRLNSKQEELKVVETLLSEIISFNKSSIFSFKRKLKSTYSEIAHNDDIVLGKLYDDAITCYDTISSFNKNKCILCNTENLGDSENAFYSLINSKIISYANFKSRYQYFVEEFYNKINASKLLEIEDRYCDVDNHFFSDILKNNEFLSRDFFESNNLLSIINSYKLKLKDERSKLNTFIKKLRSAIPPKIMELVDINNVYRFTFESLIEITDLSKENNFNKKYLAELENWIKFISKIKDDYDNSYNILMDEIAQNIDSDAKSFFKEIMGNADIIPKLKKESRGQKVNVLLEKFHNNTSGLKAASLLSESYRNALSLSIYFAAAIKSKSPGNFIMVDDITSSFDSGHQIYLLNLIKYKISICPANRKGKQIILFTHDGILKKPLNDAACQINWKHYSLNHSKDFISLRPLNSNDLKINLITKITNNEYDNSYLREYYEKVLTEIIENLNLEVPFSLINNHDERMLKNMVTAISEIIELKKLARKIKRGLTLPDRNDYKSHITYITNLLSHHSSSSSSSFSNSFLMHLISDIDTFKRKFQYNCTCSKNLGWVYYKSLRKPRQKDCTCNI